MNTPVLKRRLNPFLLATTVLVLSLLAGLSVMYQGQLSDILSDKNNLEQQLEDSKERISTLEAENANMSQQIQEKDNRISNLASESSSLESEVNSLESDVSTLENQNADLESDISELESKNDNLTLSRDMINLTLETICENGNNTIQDGEDHCEEWDHQYEGN